MKKITLNGVEYKTKSKVSVFKDVIAMLPYTFVSAGVIKQDEWARSHQLITERFNLIITEIAVDGRKKEIKNLPYFTWNVLKTA
jgi:hypothetical protein